MFTPPESVSSLLKNRYYLPGEDWEGLCSRVARAAAQAERTQEAQKEWEKKFYSLLSEAKILPNTPALVNAGAPHAGSVAACFALRPDDSMESIMENARLAAMILKFGGGIGFELSRIRPEFSRVQSTHKKAMGPIGVMKFYHAVGEMVTQAGIRKAALLSLLRIEHPDIIKYIRAKNEDAVLTNFNISVSVPDAWMKKLLAQPDKPFTAHFGGKQYNVLCDGTSILRTDRGSKKVLSMQDLWNIICASASTNGDPGIVFIDTVNKDNPLIDGPGDSDSKYYLHSVNACLSGDTRLRTSIGSIPIERLYQENHEHLYLPGAEAKEIKIIYKGIQQIVEVTTKEGISIKCTPDHLFLELGSDPKWNPSFFSKEKGWVEAKDLVGKTVAATLYNGGHATITSVTPAGEEKVYDFTVLGEPDFHKQRGFANSFIVHNCSELPLLERQACLLCAIDLGKYVIDGELSLESLQDAFESALRMMDDLLDVSPWPDISIKKSVEETRKLGIGVMGFATMLDKLGIKYGSEECLKQIQIIGAIRETSCSKMSKKLAEERGVYPAAREGEKHRNIGRTCCQPTGSLAMIADTSWAIEPHTYWAFIERRNEEERRRYLPSVKEYLSDETLSAIEEEAGGDLREVNRLIQAQLPEHMVLSGSISPEDHLKVVAEWQKYTDSSISKTIVLPQAELTEEQVSWIYKTAWELKLKGLTVYPEGSRAGEPMSLGKAKKKKREIKLPDELDSKRYKVEFNLAGQIMKAFMHVGFHPNDKEKPVEVFLTHPYSQDLTFIQFISMMTRLISLCLRYRVCPHCLEESLPIGQIIKQLDETDGQNMFSVPKIFTHVLSQFLDDGESVGTCPQCGGDLVVTGKCPTCVSCSWSKCG
jgi:ribonucleoside-diphosphate reductase alpha chain